MRFLPSFVALSTLLLAAGQASAAATETKVVGWVEKIGLHETGIVLKAKMDTGATTSSIDAEVVHINKADDGSEKIVFAVTDEDGAKKTYERKIERWVRIKRHGGNDVIRRPVITMKFCIAGQVVDEEVNLANRENFIYPVLIGRNMMKHANLAIDPSRTFTARPVCAAKKDA